VAEASDKTEPVTQRAARVQVWVVGAVVALLGLGCLLILRPFISAALWAAILCFTTWPLFLRLEQVLGGRSGLAALIATLALAATIAAPFVILGSTLASNLADLTTAAEKLYAAGPPAPPLWVADIPLVGARLSDYWLTMTESSAARIQELAKLLPAVKNLALGSGKILGSGLVQIFLSLFIAFFFYRDGKSLATQLSSGIYRIGGDRGNALLELAGSTVRAVVYGILGTALIQGGMAAFGFLIAGVPGAAFLGFVTFILSMLPGGPLLVALPAAYWLYHQSFSGWAIFIVIWGVIVGSIDNVIKPLLIGRGVSTPLILVMLGVFGGALAFGLIGLFIGPTVLALGYTLYVEWTSVVALGEEAARAPASPQAMEAAEVAAVEVPPRDAREGAA
jgi:predicted PurR-regulated permease PerM